MPEKGGDIFPSEPSAPTIRTTRNKKNKTPRRQQRARKGGDIFPQNTKFPCVASLVNKLSIEVPQRKKPPFLFHRLPPGDGSLGRGVNVFPRNTTLTSVTSDDNNLLLEGHVWHPTKADQFLPKGICPCKKQPSKRSPGTTRWQGGRRFSPKTKSPRVTQSYIT